MNITEDETDMIRRLRVMGECYGTWCNGHRKLIPIIGARVPKNIDVLNQVFDLIILN